MDAMREPRSTPASDAATMQAAVYRLTGAASDVLSLERLAIPEPGPGEVRVRVRASGVNPSDVAVRAGKFPGRAAYPLVIPHSDGAGEIEAVGIDVPNGRIGERVWIWNAQWQRPFGTAAEYVVVPAGQAVRLPDATGFDEGACFGVPLLTAWRAVTLGGAMEGRVVMVAGGAGSVGNYAVQIAKAKGATVIATATGTAKKAHAFAAGADHVIDYKAEDVPARVAEITGGQGLHHLVDLDLAGSGARLADMMAPHGSVAAYSSQRPDVTFPFVPALIKSLSLHLIHVYSFVAEVRAEALADVTAMLQAGRLRHTVGARFPLAQIAKAHEAVEGGRVMGHVVVDLP